MRQWRGREEKGAVSLLWVVVESKAAWLGLVPHLACWRLSAGPPRPAPACSTPLPNRPTMIDANHPDPRPQRSVRSVWCSSNTSSVRVYFAKSRDRASACDATRHIHSQREHGQPLPLPQKIFHYPRTTSLSIEASCFFGCDVKHIDF